MTVPAVARVWRMREQAEHEAAMQFAHLARELAVTGFPDALTELALRASRDETRHAALCRGVVAAHAPGLPPLEPRPLARLGPPSLSRRQRALYQAVALCCVTETLSVALLLEMRSCVRDPPVVVAVTRIARDESRHSQLGWAVLERVGRHADLSWLSPHIGSMLRASLEGEDLPVIPDTDLGGHGILPAPRSREIAAAVAQGVIFPGLQQYGIATAPIWMGASAD